MKRISISHSPAISWTCDQIVDLINSVRNIVYVLTQKIILFAFSF